MGLNDLVEDTSLNQFSEGEEKEEEEKEQYFTVHADFTKEEKPCPTCRCISSKKKDSNSWYKCPNPDCGTVLFMAGWNDRRIPWRFMGKVEITGWRYEDV